MPAEELQRFPNAARERWVDVPGAVPIASGSLVQLSLLVSGPLLHGCSRGPCKFGSEKTPPGGAADILGVNPGNASHRSGSYPPRPSHRRSVPPPLIHTLLSPANHASAACSPFCTLGGSDASRSIRTTMLRGAMESTPHGLARPWRSCRRLLAPLACYGLPPTH